MRQLLSRLKPIALICALLAAPGLLLYSERFLPSLRNRLVNASAALQQPFAYLLHGLGSKVGRYRAAFRSSQEWEQLREQAGQTTRLQIALEEQLLENERLRALLGAKHKMRRHKTVWARVIGRRAAPLASRIRINQGRTHGIAVGNPVLDDAGAVGQVIAVADWCSDVLLISSPSSAVDVVVQRTRARGLARGTGSSDHIRATDFDQLHTVQEGDVVVTSGIGANFPRGTPFGRVSRVERAADGVYTRVNIKPTSDLACVEDVLILTQANTSPFLAPIADY